MGKAISTVEGWHSQHMVFAMDFSAWNCFTEDEKQTARNELKAFLADLEAKHQAKEGSYAFYDCNGAKGDLILWILGPSLEYLAQVERKFRRLAIASVLVQTYSYTSVTEVSTYVKAKLDTEEVNQKLYPHVPRDKYICFYNMSKKREGDDNWFMLPPQERGALMKAHGELGKTYLDVLSEFTTGGCAQTTGNGALPFSATTTSNSKKLYMICALKLPVQNMVSSATSTLVPSSMMHYQKKSLDNKKGTALQSLFVII